VRDRAPLVCAGPAWPEVRPAPVRFRQQLREKQKIRRIYGVLERQFRRVYAEAVRRKGQTGENMLQLLESRLDTVAYRMGFGASRAESRQVVRHNGVLVNGKRVNIPSYEVRPGDVVELTERARAICALQGALEAQASRGFPDWIDVDSKAGTGVFKVLSGSHRPAFDDQRKSGR
jgi:small subunit ribosomal protein S4